MRSFQDALRSGHAAERQWVNDARKAGVSVAHGRKLLIQKHNKKTDHVESPDAVALLAIEIKERSLKFTSPEDYPYDTVFVDDLRGLERETLKNFAYVFLSKPTGKWVWVTALDRDVSWTEETVFDRGRGHEVPTLLCPKKFLRPAQSLIDLLYPHHLLSLVDGETGAFVSGGGEAEERDRYIKTTHPDAGGRGRKAKAQAHRDLG
jgi:hypothetical protein